MAEIEQVAGGVSQAFKGKKAVYLIVGVAVVGVGALAMRSMSGSSSAGTTTAAASTDNTAAINALGGSMQQSQAALQQHMDESNATLASGISAIATQAGNQDAEIKALQDQMTAALNNEQSMVNSIGSLAAAATAQAKQSADQQTNFNNMLTTILSNEAQQAQQVQQQQQQQQSLLNSILSKLASIGTSSSSSSSNTNGGYNYPSSSQPNPAPAPVIKTIFAAAGDMAAVLQKWGGKSNYRIVQTDGMDQATLRTQLQSAGQNGLIVGGVNAGGGITAAASNGTGVARVSGNDAAATAAAVQNINF